MVVDRFHCCFTRVRRVRWQTNDPQHCHQRQQYHPDHSGLQMFHVGIVHPNNMHNVLMIARKPNNAISFHTETRKRRREGKNFTVNIECCCGGL